MLVLGIETSCDETGVALCDDRLGVLGEALHSQVDLHALYGGVVPELASRAHIRRAVPLAREALAQAGRTLADVDLIAYTQGPGLAGALLVGASLAAGLGIALSRPVVGIHHLEGHLLSPLLADPRPEFPFVALLVSGGHTQLMAVEGVGRYALLGETVDDAAGEAFDKTASLLGLAYPGGPALSRLAQSGDPKRFAFPRPMIASDGLDFSFSGLKTAAMQCVRRHPPDDRLRADVAASFQAAVVDVLAAKCLRALDETGMTRLVVAGGVGANTALRGGPQRAAAAAGPPVFFPPPQLCTDNGAMIAFAAALRHGPGGPGRDDFTVRPRWDLATLAG